MTANMNRDMQRCPMQGTNLTFESNTGPEQEQKPQQQQQQQEQEQEQEQQEQKLEQLFCLKL